MRVSTSVLAPFQILTGAAQSPAIEARFPWFVRLFGGRQWARSLHFLGLVAFRVFIAIHVSMVFFWGWGQTQRLDDLRNGPQRHIGRPRCSFLIIARHRRHPRRGDGVESSRPRSVRRVLAARSPRSSLSFCAR